MLDKNKVRLSCHTLLNFRKFMGGILKAAGLADTKNMTRLNGVRTVPDARKMVRLLNTAPALAQFTSTPDHPTLEGFRAVPEFVLNSTRTEIEVVRIYFMMHGLTSRKSAHIEAFVVITDEDVGLTLPGGLLASAQKGVNSYDKNATRSELERFSCGVGRGMLYFYRILLNGFEPLIKFGNCRNVARQIREEIAVLQRPERAFISPDLLPNLPAFFQMVDRVFRSRAVFSASLAERYAQVKDEIDGQSSVQLIELLNLMCIKQEVGDLLDLGFDGAALVSLGAKVALYDENGRVEEILTFKVEEGYGAGTFTFSSKNRFAVSTGGDFRPCMHPASLRHISRREENRLLLLETLKAFGRYAAHHKAVKSRCQQAIMYVGSC